MGPQYTSCVAPKDFEGKPEAAAGVLITLGVISFLAALAFPLWFWVSAAFFVQALRIVLDWMLNGKLICLHRNDPNCNCGDSGAQVCALGQVADIEGIGEDKNPIEDVDNDYAINLLLAPQSLPTFGNNPENSFDFINNYTNDTITAPAKANLALAQAGLQGDLLSAQKDMPGFAGYFRTFIHHPLTNEWFAWTEIFGHNYGSAGPSDAKSNWADHLVEHAWKQPKLVSIPVLHCEFEGARIRDLLDVINAFSLGGSWCKKNFVFRIVCTILQSLFAPIILAAILIAWADADDGDPNDALANPEDGEVKPRDYVIIKGRWAYDGGHDGYNEIHAVRIMQKVAYVPTTASDFANFQKHWCERLGEVPHPIDATGSTSSPLTPAQQTVHDNQQRPENTWDLHPEIDGCDPRLDPNPIR